jgi:hypothetical protein
LKIARIRAAWVAQGTAGLRGPEFKLQDHQKEREKEAFCSCFMDSISSQNNIFEVIFCFLNG